MENKTENKPKSAPENKPENKTENKPAVKQKTINKKLVKRSFYDMGINIAAALCCGVAIYNLARANHFPVSGVSGLLLLANHLFGVKLGVFGILVNIPIILVCRRFLSKKFVYKSIATLITYSLVIDYVCPLIPLYTDEKILAAILTGTLLGFANALIYSNNTSGGGMDFISMSIKNRHPHLSIGSINFAIAFVIIGVQAAVYKDFTSVIYGILIVFISSIVTDKILASINAGKLLFIISGKNHEIAHIINDDIDRSATLITGTGTYTGHASHILMCACTDRQSYEIREKVHEIDPHAFTIIVNSREVVGKGFLKQ